MTSADLTAIVRGLAPVLREYFTTISDRFALLEAKERGLDGKPGPVGPEGKPGPYGLPGRDGERGMDGAPGPKGTDGRDGTLEQIRPVYDAETRTMSFVFRDDGRPVDGWAVKLVGATAYRGIYESTRAYETGDQVTYGGSQWTAKADSLGKQPGTNEGAQFWQLSAKRGNDGKAGPKGMDGKDGKPGLPGKDGIRY